MHSYRRLQNSFLPLLNSTFDSEFGRSHADDLADQIADRISFWTAWTTGALAGHGLVNWKGSRDSSIAAVYPGIPEIYRMSVLEPYQSKGVGTGLIQECEREAVERGCHRIGLGVDHSNPRAKALYIRLGYQNTELNNCIDRYQTIDRAGDVVWVEEPGCWLVKNLEP